MAYQYIKVEREGPVEHRPDFSFTAQRPAEAQFGEAAHL